jgi:hypothetical protein
MGRELDPAGIPEIGAVIEWCQPPPGGDQMGSHKHCHGRVRSGAEKGAIARCACVAE